MVRSSIVAFHTNVSPFSSASFVSRSNSCMLFRCRSANSSVDSERPYRRSRSNDAMKPETRRPLASSIRHLRGRPRRDPPSVLATAPCANRIATAWIRADPSRGRGACRARPWSGPSSPGGCHEHGAPSMEGAFLVKLRQESPGRRLAPNATHGHKSEEPNQQKGNGSACCGHLIGSRRTVR